MDSKELGIVLAQQLTDIQDLHYGYWEEGSEPSVMKFFNAQESYTRLIISSIQQATGNSKDIRILDVGCGTGNTLVKLLKQEYRVDAVIPSEELKKQVNEKIQLLNSDYKPVVYKCNFEDFPIQACDKQYDLIFFSESFQYIPMQKCFSVLKSILKPDGKVLICDFFKTPHHGDGAPGDRSFGGGHPIKEFYSLIDIQGFTIEKDEDITKNVSPTIELLGDILMKRIVPALQSVDQYLSDRNPLAYKLVKWIYRKKQMNLKYKYFSGNRSKEIFEKYKTYHLTVIRLADSDA